MIRINLAGVCLSVAKCDLCGSVALCDVWNLNGSCLISCNDLAACEEEMQKRYAHAHASLSLRQQKMSMGELVCEILDSPEAKAVKAGGLTEEDLGYLCFLEKGGVL